MLYTPEKITTTNIGTFISQHQMVTLPNDQFQSRSGAQVQSVDRMATYRQSNELQGKMNSYSGTELDAQSRIVSDHIYV